VLCVETGEVATLPEWCRRIAKQRGSSFWGVYSYLYTRIDGKTAYGLTWQRVGK
jgi:hypothetical protein